MMYSILRMSLERLLQEEVDESNKWLNREKEESTYKRDLQKRIELINWVLINMKNPDIEICSLIESRMNETIQEIKKKDSIFESDILDSELRILDWIFYQVCKDQQKNWAEN
jgi:hypothetical protein